MKKKDKKDQEEAEKCEKGKNDENDKSRLPLRAGDAGRGGVELGREMAAEERQMMEGWSADQLELFHALVQVVSKVGKEGAAGEFS